MERDLSAIVLAAGLGTRMRSRRAKVLHELGGEPMITRVARTLTTLGARPLIFVVGHQRDQVALAARRACARDGVAFAHQARQLGTGDAARAGVASLDPSFTGDVLISYGDLPMLAAATLSTFVAHHRASGAQLSFITLELDDAGAYGRVIRDASGTVASIVEARDADATQRAIKEVNTGVYVAGAALLREVLGELRNENSQGEFYLTDIVAIARRRGARVDAYRARDAAEFAGVNSHEELAAMETNLRDAVNRRLMAAGVKMVDPATAYISEQSQVAPDCVIGPNVQILGRCRIGEGVVIDGTAWLKDVTVGPRCHLKLGVRAEECSIGEESEIGPFANLRAGTELEGHNRIGNFVETKKAKLGRGTKASHLSYLGDATIGRDTNVGCGVITVNYDGYDKHVTEIGDRCMVGCDTQLIAPVKVGNDVYVASGATIVRDVENGALVLSQHPQREKAGWMARFHERHAGRQPWWVEKS
ncbi:MAG: bifunctional UDP-N-acetylglucosamine diphosphorylase/glucosamine-1-phosphate N-acetyltransferase GlmU [Candidatus Binataceae bacterium]